MKEDDNKTLLTHSEAAQYLRVCPAWLYHKARANEIPYVRLSRHTRRYRKNDLDAWMDSNSAGPKVKK